MVYTTMELNEFIEKFREELEIESVEELDGDTEFHQLEEWTSMAGLTFMALCDSTFHVNVTADEIRSSETIEELYNIVTSKM